MTRPRTAVLIVSYNRADDLRLALAGLFAGSLAPDEVVVVDNASTDGSADVAASFPGVVVQRNATNVGFAEGNDQALALTTAEYVALLNNDAVPHRDWLRLLVERMGEADDVAGVGGKAYFWNDAHPVYDERNPYYGYARVDERTGYTYPEQNCPDDVREVAFLSGCAVMFRRSAIDRVGHPFLDPLFFTYFEETDFCARALRKGFRFLYDGRAAVWHRLSASTARAPYRYHYYFHRNRALFAARNFDPDDLARVERDLLRTWARDMARPFDRSIERQARIDAARWLFENRETLASHRRAVWGPGRSYQRAVRELQARAGYFDHDRPEVRALVPTSARRVLDVGCGGGALGAALRRERPGIEVRGVEPSAAAERARLVLDDVARAGAEVGPPEGWPRPDCIVFADVLEHLVDPWAVLRHYRGLVTEGGSLVVSLPNVRHASVLGPLLRGRLDYEGAGVLDRTHLRFFTPSTARELLEETGWRVEHTERVMLAGRSTARLARVARVAEALGAAPGRDDSAFARGVGLVADLAAVQILLRATPC